MLKNWKKNTKCLLSYSKSFDNQLVMREKGYKNWPS